MSESNVTERINHKPAFVGVDPDMHDLFFAYVGQDGNPVGCEVVRVGKKKTDRDALLTMCLALNAKNFHWLLRQNYDLYFPAAAVESQELYQGGASATKNPRSIMQLATVAGATMATILQTHSVAHAFFPAPQAWKGSVPKHIHQARICSRLGWKYNVVGDTNKGTAYCVVTNPPDFLQSINKSDWKHCIDSFGLALYAREQYGFLKERTERLAKLDKKD